MPVVDEANVRDEDIEVHMASNIWTTVMATNPKHQQLTEELLANLAKQTSLDFKFQKPACKLRSGPFPSAARNAARLPFRELSRGTF